MEIAILGYRRERRNDVEAHLFDCLGKNSSYTIRQYGMEEPIYNKEPPPEVVAAFVIIDDAKAIITAQTMASWGKDFPLVMVATHPQYAMEGIRLNVRHYILFPLEQKDIQTALHRMGVVENEHSSNHDF